MDFFRLSSTTSIKPIALSTDTPPAIPTNYGALKPKQNWLNHSSELQVPRSGMSSLQKSRSTYPSAYLKKKQAIYFWPTIRPSYTIAPNAHVAMNLCVSLKRTCHLCPPIHLFGSPSYPRVCNSPPVILHKKRYLSSLFSLLLSKPYSHHTLLRTRLFGYTLVD